MCILRHVGCLCSESLLHTGHCFSLLLIREPRCAENWLSFHRVELLTDGCLVNPSPVHSLLNQWFFTLRSWVLKTLQIMTGAMGTEGDKCLQPCWFLSPWQAHKHTRLPTHPDCERREVSGIPGPPCACGACSQGAWPLHHALPPPPPWASRSTRGAQLCQANSGSVLSFPQNKEEGEM